ncbi:hypothetical protein [Dyadobacter psychrotolerans]|uniref:Uncharacterized protein n=1 Tax=Dyadobacter psychrotolerans TaxID=2541721 RepID=A0A4R5DW40_9BACT|nr:hypothetical protein [Dyadobacter psychrotolerans]TDE15475.1 hypothetical protein E0F88_13270 [Dyadobacter psychrotolerans]
MEQTTLSTSLLRNVMDFLSTISETNEDTDFDASQDYLVEAIKTLVSEKDKTSVVEDFEVPYLHPMITIQKWNEELKLIVSEAILEKEAQNI